MTAALLGAGLVAVAAAAGVLYTSASQSSASVQQWASAKINGFLNGRSISDVFGGEYIRLLAGKMIIPANIYNVLNDLIDDDVDNSGVTPGTTKTVPRVTTDYGRTINYVQVTSPYSGTLFSYNFDTAVDVSGVSVFYNPSNRSLIGYELGEVEFQATVPSSFGDVVGYALVYSPPYVPDTVYGVFLLNTQQVYNWYYYFHKTVAFNDINIGLDRTWEKDVCDVGYQWEGNIAGSEVDTNIDELMDTIFKESASDTLGVSGEITQEVPYPPQPTEIPLDDILGGMDTINDSINDQGDAINDSLDNIRDGIHSQTGTIADSAASAAEAVTDAVGSLEGTLEDALDIPSASTASAYKWDLSQLFPFCIPFDIAAMLQAFDGVAAAPHLQIPIVIQSIGFNYTLDLDFSPFNPVAAIMRQVELIAFAVALAWGTSKVIRW